MSAATSIEWTATVNPDGTVTPGKTWNPVRGCSVISPGCVNCYAMKQAHRFSGPGKAYEGLTKLTKAGPQWTGQIRTVEDALIEPLAWRKPARVFVNSMSDLFHESVPDQFIDKVFAVMALARNHTFQILTKRADRMRAYLADSQKPTRYMRVRAAVEDGDVRSGFLASLSRHQAEQARSQWWTELPPNRWPLPNVWLGVSVEDQKHADERIPLLLQTPAAVRFISAEPLLGQVDLSGRLGRNVLGVNDSWRGLDWVIVGGESGPGARFGDGEWIRSIVQQCVRERVPVFVKQMGTRPHLKDRKGGDMSEWPEDLRVREFPTLPLDRQAQPPRSTEL